MLDWVVLRAVGRVVSDANLDAEPVASFWRSSLNKYMVALLLPPPSHNTSIFLASG